MKIVIGGAYLMVQNFLVSFLRNKKGVVWTYVVAIMLALIVIFTILLLSNTFREKAFEGIRYFFEDLLGR